MNARRRLVYSRPTVESTTRRTLKMSGPKLGNGKKKIAPCGRCGTYVNRNDMFAVSTKFYDPTTTSVACPSASARGARTRSSSSSTG